MRSVETPEDAGKPGSAMVKPGVVAGWQSRIQEAPKYKWIVQAVVSVGIVMSTLDQTMLNVALPTITGDLNTNLTTIQWVVSGYLVTITSLLLTFGRLGDLLGRKQVYITGFAIFTFTSALSGTAHSVEQLILFRVLQGVGAAMMLGNHQAIIASVFPANELGRAMGVATTVVAVSTMVGPSLGGFIVGAFDWRTSFILRIPLGIIGLVLASLVFKSNIRRATRPQFDYLGALMVGSSIVSLLLGISQGEDRGWSSPLIVGLFATFVISIVCFIMVETRSKSPLLDLSIFRTRLFAAACFCQFLSFLAIFAVSVLVPFYLVQVAGYKPAEAGLMLSAQPLAMALMAPISGSLSERFGSKWLSSAGLSFSCLGLLLLSGLGVGSSPFDVVLRLALIGLGVGLFQPPNNSAIIGSTPPDKIGVASGFVPLMRNLGSVVGTGVLSAVFAARIAVYGGESGTGGALGQLADPGVMASAFHDTFIVAAAICSVGIFVSLNRGASKQARAVVPNR